MNLRLLHGGGLEDGAYPDTHSTTDKIYTVFTRIGATLSLLAALCILIESIADLRTNRRQTVAGQRQRSVVKGKTISRTLCAISVGILCDGIALLLGRSAIPSDLEEYLWGATGNMSTCELQGFLLTFGIVVFHAFDAVLSVTYVLMVRYNWRREQLITMEKIVHLIIWSLALVLSFAALATDSYNPSQQYCSIGTLPPKCGDDEDNDEDKPECIRGGLPAHIIALITQIIAIGGIVTSVICMLILYCTIRGIEQKTEKYSSHFVGSSISLDNIDLNNSKNTLRRNSSTILQSAAKNKNNNKRPSKSRQVGIQGILYSSALMICVIPLLLQDIINAATSAGSSNLHLAGIARIATSLIGFVYILVFLRDRIEMKTCYGKAFRRVLFCGSSTCFCAPVCDAVSCRFFKRDPDDPASSQQNSSSGSAKNFRSEIEIPFGSTTTPTVFTGGAPYPDTITDSPGPMRMMDAMEDEEFDFEVPLGVPLSGAIGSSGTTRCSEDLTDNPSTANAGDGNDVNSSSDHEDDATPTCDPDVVKESG